MIVCIFFSACTIWGINIDSSKCQNKTCDENIESWNRVAKKIEYTSAVHYNCFYIFLANFAVWKICHGRNMQQSSKGSNIVIEFIYFFIYIIMVVQYDLELILGIPWFVLYCYCKSCRIWMMIPRNEVWIKDVRIYHTCCCCCCINVCKEGNYRTHLT